MALKTPYADCHYPKCRYANCRGALKTILLVGVPYHEGYQMFLYIDVS
jgi:hypothetical protein